MHLRKLLIAILLPGISRLAHAQELLWSDEFDNGDDPNFNIWSYDTGGGGWGNDELQVYDSRNRVSVENGNLIISVTKDDATGTISSGRIQTNDKLQFLYGRIEARIKIPDPANGLWPSLWMLGANFDDVGWPGSGSLTLMEMGSADALQLGEAKSRVGSALHWEQDGAPANEANTINSGNDLTSDFHTYVMEWTPASIITSVDGVQILQKDISSDGCPSCDEFHRPYFLILSVAVGGTYMNILDVGGITAPLPAEMLVDYIRLFDNGFTTLSGSSVTEPPTRAPTVSPTAPPTVSPTEPLSSTAPTEIESSEPSPSPSTAVPVTSESTTPSLVPSQAATTSEPTTSPTLPSTTMQSSPTVAPTTSPTFSPTSDTTVTNADQPTTPIQSVEAKGFVMTLTDVKPLNSQDQIDWTSVTHVHLANELMNVVGSTAVQISVAFVSQSPNKAAPGLRKLQAQKQDITFNANYSIPSGMRMDHVDSFVTGAFASSYKRTLYLGRLKEYGSPTFHKVSDVSVEAATSTTLPRAKDDTDGQKNPQDKSRNVGLVVGVATACVVVLILGISLSARRRRRRRGGPAVAVAVPEKVIDAAPTTGGKDMLSDRSDTIEEESMYMYSHRKGKVAPYSSLDNASSLASSSFQMDDDSYIAGLSHSDHHNSYRDTFKYISKSFLGGILPRHKDEEEATVCDEFTVEIPKNQKLGLILETFEEGCPTVQDIKPGSPFTGRVQVGDRLLRVNEQDVTTAPSDTVSRVIALASKGNCDRVFVFARPRDK